MTSLNAVVRGTNRWSQGPIRVYALGQASSSADINPQYATTCCTVHAFSDDQKHIVASKRNAIMRTSFFSLCETGKNGEF